MKLRRITVAGFKTFASRAEVTFDRGITAIVGPNGSGKSNLVDALRWALGETNARELRGQRMDEVIYAGGGRRNRVNLAEVSLLIDNDEGRLPVADAEVAVSRRVARGAGDTEFRINAERVRLRDLEELLGATGLTQNGYAVVAQNDIDGIIEATPGQRRVLVEQAAGVRSVRASADEALHRITGAEHLLQRIDALLADAEPRLAELALQAETALEQRSHAERLTGLRGSLAREAWRAARGRLKLARRRGDQATARLEAAEEADRAFASRALSVQESLAAGRSVRDRIATDLERLRLEAERAAGEARRWDERLRTAVLQRGAALRESRSALDDAAAMERALAEQRAPAPDDAAALAALVERCERLRTAEAEAAAGLRQAQEQASAASGEVSAATAALVDLEHALREHTVQLRLFETSAAPRDEELGVAEREVRRLRTAVEALETAATGAAAVAESADEAVRTAQRSVESAWQSVNLADAELAAASSEARSAQSSLAEVRGLRAGSLGGEGGVGRAVAERRLAAVRLADCAAARDPADRDAVAAALEHVLGAWVVDDLEWALHLLERPGPREHLLAAGLPADPEAVPAPWRSLLDAIDVAPRALGALGRLLRGVWLAPNLQAGRAALQAGAVAAVLPDGTVLSAAGVRGGDPGSALLLKEEEATAAGEAGRAAERESVAIAVVAAAREALAEAEQRLSTQAEAARQGSAAAATAGAQLDTERRALATAEQRVVVLLERREERLRDEQAVSARAASLRSRRDDALARREAATRQHAQLQAVLDSRRAESEAAVHAAREAEVELARLEAATGGMPQRTEELEAMLDSARRRRVAADRRVEASELAAIAALAVSRAARQRRDALDEAVAAAEAALDKAAAPLTAVESALRGIEVERAEVAVALARAGDEHAAATAEIEEANAEAERLAEAARDEADDDEDWDPEAAEKAEREIVRLERRIASLGPVNALAPEQHAALAARVEHLHRDGDDLDTACADIRAMAAALIGDVERRFEAVFAEVSQRFGETFAELFPGGRATLQLEDPEPGADLEAPALPGVEILAQLPGKRLGPLRLLSGGERALTALATVLALQQVNPSPFYVFDEVDAALDDSNVMRFTRLLRRLAERQQFIVVTHNHITMAAADVLWGVTIDSDGVSSVLGVRFDAEAHSEALTGTALRPVAS